MTPGDDRKSSMFPVSDRVAKPTVGTVANWAVIGIFLIRDPQMLWLPMIGVGIAWASIVSMPYAMFFSGGQAIHYSADFNRVGYAGGSHGCINVGSLSTAARIFNAARVGDKVIVYN